MTDRLQQLAPCTCNHVSWNHEYDRDRIGQLGVCRVKGCDCMGAIEDTGVEQQLEARVQELEIALGVIYFHARLGRDRPMEKIVGVVEFVLDDKKRLSFCPEHGLQDGSES